MNKTTSLMLVAATTVGSFTFGSAYAADDNAQHVYRAQDLQSFEGPENLFTGKVRIDMLFPENETAHYSAAYVTFQPGARTALALAPGRSAHDCDARRSLNGNTRWQSYPLSSR